MNFSWKTWLGVMAGVLVAGLGVVLLLVAQGALGAARGAMPVVVAAMVLWAGVGLFRWRSVPWVARLAWLLAGSAAALAVAMLTATWREGQGVLGLTWEGRARQAAISAVGLWAMAVLFYGGLQLIRLILSPGAGVLGVARTLVDEAIRMKIALVFIVGLAIILPVLPLALDPAERLEYRLQMFLTWSLGTMTVLLSLMTIFLATGSVAGERENRQLYLTMTKPVSRGGYVLGKWVGIALLNLLLVSVGGLGVYSFAKVLEGEPAWDATDRRAVQEQVLVARETVMPLPPGGDQDLEQMYEQRLDKLRQAEPERYAPENLTASDTDQIKLQIIASWYTVAPNSSVPFRFEGLQRAKEISEVVQLRIKPRATSTPGDGKVKLLFRVNGRPFPPSRTGQHRVIALANDNFHVIDLPTAAIDDRGELLVEIANVIPPNQGKAYSIAFSPGEGVELLYQVGTFEPNLMRSMAMIWVQLCFLGALGIMAGTFLGFHVASLLCLLVYVGATISAFLTESLSNYTAFPIDDLNLWDKLRWFPYRIGELLSNGEYFEIIKLLARLIGMGFVNLIPSLSEYNPIPLVSKGKVVSTGLLLQSVGMVGIVWTGIAGLLGWLFFKRKELAKLTGS